MMLPWIVFHLAVCLGREEANPVPWWLKNVTKPAEVPLLNYPNHVNGTVSNFYIGNWSVPGDASCNNCSGILRLTRNTGQRDTPLGTLSLSVLDTTFTPDNYRKAIYNEYFNSSSKAPNTDRLDGPNDSKDSATAPWNATRTLKIVVQIYDGSYQSDMYSLISAIGYYFPGKQRCVAKGIFKRLFKTPQFPLNETEMDKLKLSVLDDSQPFPPPANISAFDKDAEAATTDIVSRISKDRCIFDIWMTLKFTDRPYTSTYFYTPDTEASLKYRDYYTTIANDDNMFYNTSNPAEIAAYYLKKDPSATPKAYILRPSNGPATVQVPYFNLHIFSKECAVNMTLTGAADNQAKNIKIGFVFFTGLIILQLLSLLVGTYQQFTLTSEAQLMRCSAFAIYVLTISSLTHSIALLSLSTVVPSLSYFFLLSGSIASLDVLLTNIPICVTKFALWYFLRRGFQNHLALIFFLIGLTVISATPVMLGLFLPLWTNIFIIIPLLSYWLIQFVFRCIKKFANESVLSSYVIFNTLPKVYTSAYILGFPINFMDLESRPILMWVITSYATALCLLLILQNKLGYDLGLGKLFCKKQLGRIYESIYQYNAQSLTPAIMKDQNLRSIPELQLQLQDTPSRGQRLLDYLGTLQVPFLLSFADVSPVTAETNWSNNHDETTSTTVTAIDNIVELFTTNSSNEQSQWCMNPYHSHSVFFDRSLPFSKLFNDGLCPWIPGMTLDISSVDLEAETNCFYFIDLGNSNEQFICSVCLDNIAIPLLKNVDVMLVFRKDSSHFSDECARLSEMAQTQRFSSKTPVYDESTVDPATLKNYELWITPCGHCFHRHCLLRWVEQNLTCPIDRRPIPEYII